MIKISASRIHGLDIKVLFPWPCTGNWWKNHQYLNVYVSKKYRFCKYIGVMVVGQHVYYQKIIIDKK